MTTGDVHAGQDRIVETGRDPEQGEVETSAPSSGVSLEVSAGGATHPRENARPAETAPADTDSGGRSALESLRSPNSSDLATVRCPECRGRPTMFEGASRPAMPGSCLTCFGRRTIEVHWASAKDEPQDRHLFRVGTMAHEPLCEHELVKLSELTKPAPGSMPCMGCVGRLGELSIVEDRVTETSASFRRDVERGDPDWLHPTLRRPGPHDGARAERTRGHFKAGGDSMTEHTREETQKWLGDRLIEHVRDDTVPTTPVEGGADDE